MQEPDDKYRTIGINKQNELGVRGIAEMFLLWQDTIRISAVPLIYLFIPKTMLSRSWRTTPQRPVKLANPEQGCAIASKNPGQNTSLSVILWST
jgi:hypothetical protein